ncbi:unnamed protein product [Colias eurytheme]|nr:unnamed protein product [Colias eurytheme]
MQIILFILFHSVSYSQSQYIFKIEHKISDKETILDEYAISILNKTDENNQTPKTIENQKLLERSRSEDTRKTNAETSLYNTQIIPFVIQKQDNQQIKRQLDTFAMVRKKSHLTTIDFNFIPLTHKVHIPPVREKGQETNFNVFLPDLSHVMKRQNNLLDRLDKVLSEETKAERKNLRHSDASLLEDLKKLKTMKAMKQIVIQPTRKMTTILTMIDETAVREALKKDPLVKRILQMGKNKRIKYKKEVKELNKN